MDKPQDFRKQIPDGDNVQRDVFQTCGFIQYQNPKIVVGSVVRTGDGILLCRRAIPPRVGFWTLPAGYLELGETPEAGAAREAAEEVNAEIEIGELLAIYSIPRISQVQLIFRARLMGGYSAGPESQEVAVFDRADIPWPDLAFPSVHWALNHDRDFSAEAAPFRNPDGQTGDRMPDAPGMQQGL